MDARRLLRWGDVEDARRRKARGGPAALSPWVYSVIAGVALAGLAARGLGVLGDAAAGNATPQGASTLVLGAIIAGSAIVLMGAPFRLFWRRDSALIGRSAIPGRAVFMVGLRRSARAAAQASLPCAMAAAVFALGPHGSAEIALRHMALVGIGWAWAALVGPCLALVAGAVVASDQATAALKSLGGEFQAPRSSWLGILPGLGGAGVTIVLGCLAMWSRGGEAAPVGEPSYFLAAGTLVPALLLAWALPRAERLTLAAVREVAALDQERLAHIERVGPSPLERATGRMLGPGGRLVLEKDASLARRRYPIPYFVGLVGLIAQWIVAISAPDSMLVWAASISAGLRVYGVVMARRSMQAPIEHPALLRTLAIGERSAGRAKHARLGLWIAVYMVLGAAAVIARAPEPATAAAALGAIAAATLAAGWPLAGTRN